MKKILAIALVLCMAMALFACGGSGSSTGGGDSAGSTNNTDVGGGAVDLPKDETKEWPDEIGFFDATFDYSTKGPFKVGYLVSATNFLYDEFDKAFADWAVRMNINYTGMWAPAGGSGEEYLSGIETFVDQGYSGLLLDADLNLYPQVVAKCESLGIPWVSCMGQARDADYYTIGNELIAGRLASTTAGFNNTQFGIDMMDKLVGWKEENFPDVPWEKVGVISVDFSLSSLIHERTNGAEMRWAELFPQFGSYSPDTLVNPDNFWIADTSSGTMDQVTAQNLVVQILSDPGDIEVWLIPAALDDFSMGAANAAENLGMTDIVCTVCIGGSSLPVQWDSGVENAWRYANFTAQSVYAEPLIGALWAYMTEQATPETIWPEWVKIWDKGDVYDMEEVGADYPAVKFDGGAPVVIEEHSYASRLLPTQWLDIDTYKIYLEWTDLYAYGEGAPGHYGYENEVSVTLDLFNAVYDVVPDYYHEYPVQ